jgi:hypothetical protein
MVGNNNTFLLNKKYTKIQSSENRFQLNQTPESIETYKQIIKSDTNTLVGNDKIDALKQLQKECRKSRLYLSDTPNYKFIIKNNLTNFKETTYYITKQKDDYYFFYKPSMFRAIKMNSKLIDKLEID